MTPLTFGQDYTCPTCKGSGTILNGKMECGVCRGTGLHRNPEPPPELPAGGVTGRDHPETSHEAEATLEDVKVQRAHRRILELLDTGEWTDERMAEVLVRERVTSNNGFRARRGELAKAGLIDVVPGRKGITASGRQAQLWYLTAAGAQALATLEYRDQQAERKTGAE